MSDIVERLRDGFCDNPCNVQVCACGVAEEAADEITRLRTLTDRWGHEEGRLIDQRDKAEMALGDAYAAATGGEPDWSNRFGYREAVEGVRDTISVLRAENEALIHDNGRYVQIAADLTEEVESLRARVAELEAALRNTLSLLPDRPDDAVNAAVRVEARHALEPRDA